MLKKTLIACIALAALVVSAPALAGPPFNCHVFEIGSAKSLPWSGGNNWLGMRDDYDFRHVVADTEALLTPSTPILVRMETLRRASLYASRERAVAEQLIAAMMARVKSAEPGGQAVALFDAGFVVEALNEIEQSGRYTKLLAGSGRELVGLTRPSDGPALIQKSLALRPGDASIEFALGLVSRTPESEAHFLNARAGAREDALLANNLAKLQLLQ
jgi:hypothetical protein